MKKKIVDSQRMMSFMRGVDKPEVKGEHQQEFAFAKKYIKGKKVLNVGSWTGPFEILARKVAKKLTAVDVEEEALKVLKANIPEVECVVASAHDLPFEDNTFDVVTFWATIEHIPVGYELASLKEMNRILKPGGYLFLTTMQYNVRSNILDPGYWLVGHRHYRDQQLEDMLSEAGFKSEQIKKTGGYTIAFHAWAFYFFKHIFRHDLPQVPKIEEAFEKDFASPGFYQIAIRAKKV